MNTRYIAANRRRSGLVVGRSGKHYRELAHWLRGIAAKCRLPYTQKELLDLARRYELHPGIPARPGPTDF